jgi:hypothetical protein
MRVSGDRDDGVVWPALPHGAFGFAQPRADRKAELVQRAAPDIHAHALAQREGEARNTVIEDGGLDKELLLVEDVSILHG